jgi:hypothetical protein
VDAAFMLLERDAAQSGALWETSSGGLKTTFCHPNNTRTRSYGVDAAFMQLEQHGCDIHAV